MYKSSRYISFSKFPFILQLKFFLFLENYQRWIKPLFHMYEYISYNVIKYYSWHNILYYIEYDNRVP